MKLLNGEVSESEDKQPVEAKKPKKKYDWKCPAPDKKERIEPDMTNIYKAL